MSTTPIEDTIPFKPSTSPVSHLLVAILDQQLAAWHLTPPNTPQRLPLEGQERLRVESAENLVNALADLQSRLQSDGLSDWMLHLIVDAASRSQVSEGFESMSYFFQQPWQLHDWAWLQGHLELPAGADLWHDEGLIARRLLPWLTAESDEIYRAQLRKELDDKLRGHAEQRAKELHTQQRKSNELHKNLDEQRIELEKQHAKECATLERKIGRLQTQNTDLEEQHALEMAKLEKKIERLRSQNAELKEQLAGSVEAKRTPRSAATKTSAAKPAATKVTPAKAAKETPAPSTAAAPGLRTALNPAAAWPFPTGLKPK